MQSFGSQTRFRGHFLPEALRALPPLPSIPRRVGIGWGSTWERRMGLLESGRRLLRRGFRLPAKPRIPEVVYRASSQPVSRAEASRRKILLKIPLLSLGRRFVETRDAFLYLVRFLLKMENHRPIGAKARSIEETKETGRKGKERMGLHTATSSSSSFE